ncbi:MAG: hypothetical protein FWH41_01475 [Treponema sp.]|nr:hypothetical protein [Treponema sp.]
MVNIKWGIIAGTAAFVLTFLFSAFAGNSFGTILLKSLVFLGVFFAIGASIRFLIGTFIPELLHVDTKDDAVKNVFKSTDALGSKINVTVGDKTDAALPEMYVSGQEEESIGNISDLISGAVNPKEEELIKEKNIDQIPLSGYTGETEKASYEKDASANSLLGEFSLDFSSFASIADGMGGTESSYMKSFEHNHIARPEETIPERKVSGNKASKMEGDFKPKEIAAGIRTVLEKDKRG